MAGFYCLKSSKVEEDCCSLYNDNMETKLNLGCGDHILTEWDNFDTASRARSPVRVWEWNQPLPYPDSSVDVVLVQHSLQHCRPEDYKKNISEIFRVLKYGGKFLLKEADNRYYVWHRPGVTDRDGYIASSISKPEAISLVVDVGMTVCEDKEDIIKRWGDVINRQRRTLKGKNLFVIECTKQQKVN